MPKWTDEQKLAINKSGCDLLVSAAAGSGKTAVLSERVLKRITEDKVSVDRLLIVTFTEAAASEMRQRIVDKLRDKLKVGADTDYISRQLALVPKANITTIHSFCLSIIKNNFHLLDIDPGFGIMNDADKLLTLAKVGMETINDMYESYGEEFSKLLRWLADGNDEDFAQRINDIYNFIQGMEEPLEWLCSKVEDYNLNDDAYEDLPWVSIIKNKYRVDFSEVLENYKNVLSFAESAGAKKQYELYMEELMAVEKLLVSCSGTLEDISNAAACVKFNTIRKEKDADEYFQECAKTLRDKLKKIVTEYIGELKAITGKSITEGARTAYPRLKLLYETVRLYDIKYKKEKAEKNLIDFNDFEHLALKLLQDESINVAKSLREKYIEIYVDEYQDCNGVQEAIFSCIARREDGKSCNMFMVGDIKQSIYKFRQADPGIFVGKLNQYEEDGIQSKIVLNRNFRSRDTVVDCVNSLFSAIMSPTVGGISYTSNEALVAEFKYPEKDGVEFGGPAEILMISNEDAENGTSKISLEAKAVAKKIKEMVGKFNVYDTTINDYRPSNFRDFAILLRNPSGKISDIEAELKNAGIPFFSDNSGGLFDVHEINVLMSALEITDNPLQDIPLVGFMRSLPGGFDENELVTIRMYQSKGYFYEAVKKCSRDSKDISKKCNRFLEMLKVWRKYSKVASIEELIWKIIDDTGVLSYIQALPGGKNRRANIELFVEYGRQFEQSEQKGLFSFLRFIEKLEKGRSSETAKMLSDACDVVRIMSIHKSKGLEFPVVFVLNSAGKFNSSDWTSNGVLLHKDFGIGCDYMDFNKKIRYPLISKFSLSYQLKLDGLSEEMRVLYVALTRAREKLFVVASGNKAIEKLEKTLEQADEPVNLYEVAKATSYFDWICLGMREKNLWRISHYNYEALVDDRAENNKNTSETSVDKKIYDEINHRINFVYPHKAAIGISSKYSVTELKYRFDTSSDEQAAFTEFYEERLPGFMQEQKLTSRALGTILHLILKFVDFTKEPDAAIQECKEMLINNNFITLEEFENVKTDVIADFFGTSVCSSLINADKLYREIPFNINVAGDVITGDDSLKDETVLLQGIIDCLYTKGNKCYVLDYKTESRKMSEAELCRLYENQLCLYKIAAEKITGLKVGGTYLYLLNRGKLLEV